MASIGLALPSALRFSGRMRTCLVTPAPHGIACVPPGSRHHQRIRGVSPRRARLPAPDCPEAWHRAMKSPMPSGSQDARAISIESTGHHLFRARRVKPNNVFCSIVKSHSRCDDYYPSSLRQGYPLSPPLQRSNSVRFRSDARSAPYSPVKSRGVPAGV
jgi:hypothetical protein